MAEPPSNTSSQGIQIPSTPQPSIKEGEKGELGEHIVIQKTPAKSSSPLSAQETEKIAHLVQEHIPQETSLVATTGARPIEHAAFLEKLHGRSFNIIISEKEKPYHAQLEETADALLFPNSLTLNGRHYAIHAKESELSKVLDILNVLFPQAVTSSIPLPGLVSESEAHLEQISRVLPETTLKSTPTKSMPETEWMKIDRAYLADLKARFAKEYLAQVEAKKLRHEPIDEENIASLPSFLDHVSEFELLDVMREEKIKIPVRQIIPPNHFTFTKESVDTLDANVHHPDSKFSGVIRLKDANGAYTVASEGINPSTPFAIHSVGKVFTGALVICLLQKGVITEEDMKAPIQLDPSVLSRLPEPIRRHILGEKPTLKQVMLHRGGLGDYLEKYSKAIARAGLSGEEPPQIRSPEDFLPFVEETLFPLDEYHYSNVGLLLVGLSLQYLTKTPFDSLLQTHLIEPAQLTCFSSQKPPGARVNAQDPVAEHLCGSPAGGYWTTAEDLCKFGQFLTSQCTDPKFLAYLNRYGREFYSDGEIQHAGGIPSASAYLSAFPHHGVVVSIVSVNGHQGALEMYDAIRNHMLHRPPSNEEL